MEKHSRKHDCILFMVFIIDLDKAYDRVPRQEVWRRKREKEGPYKYVMIVKEMYEGAITRAKINDMIKLLDPSGALRCMATSRIFHESLPFRS